MHCTLDYLPGLARKESNVPKIEDNQEFTVLISILSQKSRLERGDHMWRIELKKWSETLKQPLVQGCRKI